MKPRTCRCDCLQMHPNQLYESARAAAFLPGADGKCAEGGRGSSERCIYSIASGATPMSSGPVPKIRLHLGISKHGSLHFTATKLTPKACRLSPTLMSRVYERRERSIFLLPSLFCHQKQSLKLQHPHRNFIFTAHTACYELRIRAPHRQSWEVESKLSKFTCTCSTDDNSCSDF